MTTVTQNSDTKPETTKNVSQEFPWSPASKVADKQGLCLLLFSPPGGGKTTLGSTVMNSKFGNPLLIVNFDGEMRSLSDRDDIQVWPGEKQGGKLSSFSQAKTFLAKLARGNHPFKTIQFDTVLPGAYHLSYKDVLARSSTRRDGRQEYGDANQEILDMIEEWSIISRESGTNVIFVCHDEEKQEGENGPIYIRPAGTPGVLRGVYQLVSAIGYLEVGVRGQRKLLLHNSRKVVAKYHQPKSGPQVPLEIPNPDLGKLLDHINGVRPYTVDEEKVK